MLPSDIRKDYLKAASLGVEIAAAVFLGAFVGYKLGGQVGMVIGIVIGSIAGMWNAYKIAIKNGNS